MNEKDQLEIIEISKKTAKFSAIIGTIILFAFLLSKNNLLAPIGIFYIFLAAIINGVLFMALFILAILSKTNRYEIITTMLILLINIPLSILYGFIAITLTPL